MPGIGTLIMVTHPAETDYVNSRLNSPSETIDFIVEDHAENVFNEFSAMSELLQNNLDENGSYVLNGIGAFKKDKDGEIQFEPIAIDPMFTPSIAAETATREVVAHNILVGDQETTNVEMTEYFSEQPPLKKRWWAWAVVLAAIGIGLLIIYFYQHGLNALANIRQLAN